MVINSKDNDKFKYFKKLQQKKYRQREKLFFVEGGVVLSEALKINTPRWIVVSEEKKDDFTEILSQVDKEKIVVCSSVLFEQLADAEHPQGIIGYFPFLHKFGLPKEGKFIYCDDIREPGNLGGMIRSADAFGLDGLILSPQTVDVYNPKTIRATMASIFRLPIYFCEREELIASELSIVATSLENAVSIHEYRFSSDEIIVIGNEARGVSREILERADNKVYIPISENVNSLNANVAASIVMYEMMHEV